MPASTHRILFAPLGRHLSSRAQAAQLREQLLQLDTAGALLLDFSGVSIVSSSFADELVGVLALRFGLDWLRDRIELQGHNAEVRRALLSAVARRLPHT